MTTHSTKPDFTNKLTGLLKKLEANRAEAGEYEKTIAAVNEEEKKLLETADLNDPESFKIISGVRLKKELIPKKITRLNELEQTILGKISWECSDLTKAMTDDLAALLNEAAQVIAKEIAPFFPGDPYRAINVAADVFRKTELGLEHWKLLQQFRTETWATNPPESQARNNLSAATDVSNLIAAYLKTTSTLNGPE